MNTHHVCFSGSLACSGSNPCETCNDVVNQHVLAFAMQGAGLTLDQGKTLFAWIKEGWRRLHLQMMQDPNISQRALDVSRVRIDPPSPGLHAPVTPAASAPQAPLPTMPFHSAPANVSVPAAATSPSPTPHLQHEALGLAPLPQQGRPFPDGNGLPQNPHPFAEMMGIDPSAAFDPRLLMMLAPMIQEMMQQAAQAPAFAPQAFIEAAQAAPPPTVMAFPEPASAPPPAVPSALMPAPSPLPAPEVPLPPRAAPARALAEPRASRSNPDEMTVEDVMSLASFVEEEDVHEKTAPTHVADVVESLNGASSELHHQPAQEADPGLPRGPDI